jgi:hypothetical protein
MFWTGVGVGVLISVGLVFMAWLAWTVCQIGGEG